MKEVNQKKEDKYYRNMKDSFDNASNTLESFTNMLDFLREKNLIQEYILWEAKQSLSPTPLTQGGK